jgi:hypothetical protein
MEGKQLKRLEQLLGRELSIEEKERLRRIKDTLQISDNDAMWDIIAAMEYQRTYYDELPEKITRTAADIFHELSQVAEKEVVRAQYRLAESVVAQAQRLSVKTHSATLLLWGILALFLLFLYGSLLMWAGFSIGSGQTHPPAILLKMPVGVIISAMFFTVGIFFGFLAAKDFADGEVRWRKRLLAAIGCLLPGGTVFGLAVF